MKSKHSHPNSTKTLEKWAFLTILCAMGWAMGRAALPARDLSELRRRV
jgi:hypothetical protein